MTDVKFVGFLSNYRTVAVIQKLITFIRWGNRTMVLMLPKISSLFAPTIMLPLISVLLIFLLERSSRHMIIVSQRGFLITTIQ